MRAKGLPHQEDRRVEELRQGQESQRRQERATTTRGDASAVVKPADAAAAAQSTGYLLYADEGDMVLRSLRVIPAATVAANGSNYATLTAQLVTRSNTRSLAAFNTSATTMYAGQAYAFDLPGSPAVPKGSCIAVAITKTGSGVALPDLLVQLRYGLKVA